MDVRNRTMKREILWKAIIEITSCGIKQVHKQLEATPKTHTAISRRQLSTIYRSASAERTAVAVAAVKLRNQQRMNDMYLQCYI